MTTNQERAADLIADATIPPGTSIRRGMDRAILATKFLADAGLLMPDEDERLPSWVYDHPDVWTNPWRVGGVPCVRGTRIPVDIVLDWIEGAPDDDLREFYPDIPTDVINRLRTAREEHNDA